MHGVDRRLDRAGVVQGELRETVLELAVLGVEREIDIDDIVVIYGARPGMVVLSTRSFAVRVTELACGPDPYPYA